MSSPSGPYKSRTVTGLVENYHKFVESCGLAWRQVKFTTTTTLQTIAYSVYSLVQTLRGDRNTLNSDEHTSSPQLGETESVPQLAVDESVDSIDPIKEILQIATAEVKHSSALPSTQFSIQGIATQLQDRKLVLVGSDHQVRDVLTPQQQKLLRKYIRQVEQDSDISLARFNPNPALNSIFNSAITPVTQTVQDLSNTLTQAWQKSSALERAAIAVGQGSISTTVEANLHNLQAVIWAAVDYFFFKDHNRQLQLESDSNPALSGKPTPQILNPPKTPTSLPRFTSFRAIFNPSNTSVSGQQFQPVSPVATPLTKIQKYAKETQEIVSQTLKPEAATEAGGGNTGAISISNFSDCDRQEAGEWFETAATSSGYIKHPLERILDALDRILFWIEEAIMNLWQWLKQKVMS